MNRHKLHPETQRLLDDLLANGKATLAKKAELPKLDESVRRVLRDLTPRELEVLRSRFSIGRE
jgi:DNA-directed RNA polymerase sigma subunit (sigma70/sigma32)